MSPRWHSVNAYYCRYKEAVDTAPAVFYELVTMFTCANLQPRPVLETNLDPCAYNDSWTVSRRVVAGAETGIAGWATVFEVAVAVCLQTWYPPLRAAMVFSFPCVA